MLDLDTRLVSQGALTPSPSRQEPLRAPDVDADSEADPPMVYDQLSAIDCLT